MGECLNRAAAGHPRLAQFDRFPDALLEVPAADLWQHLPGPTLFEIAGRAGAPLFVTVLLHGNEETGWQALQSVLRHHRGRLPPRPLLLFVGNIEAARARVRTLPWQNDYNRVWPGTPTPAAPEAALMRDVTDIAASCRPFASIDIHNNTGTNPHYACVNRLDEPVLHLARLFGRTVVYFTKPTGVQSAALSRICPAVTVECGQVEGANGAAHAAEFVSAALALSHFPVHPVPDHDIDLLQTFAIVKVPPEATLSYDGSEADFRFRNDLDHLNFSELDPGAEFGAIGRGGGQRLEVVPGGEFAAVENYFEYTDRRIRLSRKAIPAMLTCDTQAVRLDCLGYLMHRIGRDGRRVVE